MLCRIVPPYIVFTALAQAAFAHPDLGSYLQHRIALTPAADHIEVVIEITFDGARSLAERKRIDANGDGKLSRNERDAYLQGVQGEAETRVTLSINGKQTRLLALYAPKLDLLDSRDIEQHPHVLQLSFFASAQCSAGDHFTVIDDLWSDSPAIMLAEAGEGPFLRLAPRQSPMPERIRPPGTSSSRTIDYDAVTGGTLRQKPKPKSCDRGCGAPMMSRGRPPSR